MADVISRTPAPTAAVMGQFDNGAGGRVAHISCVALALVTEQIGVPQFSPGSGSDLPQLSFTYRKYEILFRLSQLASYA
jgi:hypothetical protein